MKILNTPGDQQVSETDNRHDVSRRRFFQLAGGITGAGLVLSACRRTPSYTTFIGDGDAGLMNMMYVVEQVQAGFYTQAVLTPYYNITTSESLCFVDLRDQAIAHSEYLKALLGAKAAKPIVLNLSLAIFADRTSTLANAFGIADLAVGGYNGAARLLSSTDYIHTISKIATVQARRSAYMRDTLNFYAHGNYDTFADASAVDSNGLDLATQPASVMAGIEQYIQTKFDISTLPSF